VRITSGLAAADLRALANLPATALGRRLLLGVAIGMALLATLSWWFAEAVASNPVVLRMLHDSTGGDSQRGLIGYGLMAGPLVATWLGLAFAQRQLFETPELVLWRQAPIAPWRGAMQVLLRATFLSWAWASALALPFLSCLLRLADAPAWAYALAPLAVLGATAPLLAVLLAAHVVMVRFFAGRVLRLVFVLLGALASVGFSTWLLLTMLARTGEREHAVVSIARVPGELPWTVGGGASLLAGAARGVLDTGALLVVGGWLAATLVGFALVARLHPRAWERHLAAEPPLWRDRGRTWPCSLAATVRKKEYAQLLQQPGALVGFLVFAVLVFALQRQQLLVGGILTTPNLPRDVLHAAVLFTHWFLAVLLVLYAHMGRLVAWDAPQWPLWLASPARPGAILRGKLTAIFVLLLWPLLLVALAGAVLLDASRAALLTFAGVAIGGTLAALGVLAAIGTWPRLMRPDDAGHGAQGGRSFVAALVLVLAYYVAMSPALFLWAWLVHGTRYRTLLPDEELPVQLAGVGIACAYGAVVLALGMLAGARNYRVLLEPR
jgi:hypothetical protein